MGQRVNLQEMVHKLAYTAAEASFLLSLEKNGTLDTLHRSGKLRAVMVGSHKRWLRQDIIDYLAKLREENGGKD